MDAEVNGINEGSMDAPIPDENLVEKARVTELIKKEKEAAYRKAQREYQTQLEAMKTGQTQGLGGMQQSVDIDSIKQDVIKHFQAELQKAQEESQKAEHENFIRQNVETYLGKMSNAPSIADDFKEITAKFKPDKFREVFYLANSFENTPAIIYELQKNPTKLANIEVLAKFDPEMAREQIAALSKSIEANNEAKSSNQSAPTPLSRPKQSLQAGSDNGKMSLQDFKKASWLRG